MSEAVQSAHTSGTPYKRSLQGKLFRNKTVLRGLVAIIGFIIFWEICSRFKQWFGVEIWWIGKLAPPTDVVAVWLDILPKVGYWESWGLSFGRVFLGFAIAQVIGIPFGLLLAVNKYFRDIFFPPFEILRPIPPLAWVPASIIFWPRPARCGRATGS